MIRRAASAAGPALILLATLTVLHRYWLDPRLTNQHPDLLAFWLPRWCFLGKSLVSGHVPTWLPSQAGGLPFASDPQSGWLYLPPMLFFTATSCARALGLMIVFNPMLAGLAMYLFLRLEGLGRPAATVGGLTLALAMSDSVVVLSMPFAATIGWTVLSLAGASGFARARTPQPALAWLALTSLGLSQVAAAHLTSGLLLAFVVLGLYMAARTVAQIRGGESSALAAVLRGLAPFAAFPLLAAAVLLPRLALLPRTSLGHGYVELQRLSEQLTGVASASPLASGGTDPWWGTSFARGPQGYVGGLAIMLVPLALSSKRWRPQAAAFSVAGFLGWLLNMDALISSGAVRDFVLKSPLGELWLRDPYRFRYLLLLAFAALAGYGLQAWLDATAVDRLGAALKRLWWLLPSVVVFAVWPIAWGSRVAPYATLLLGCSVLVPVLIAAARGRTWAFVALPLFVALELGTSGIVAQARPTPGGALAPEDRPSDRRFGHSFEERQRPAIVPGRYLTAGGIGAELISSRADHGRYLSFDPQIARDARAFLKFQAPEYWPAYENGRSILFGIEEIQGYLPMQIDRYWRLVRRANPKPIFYNEAAFQMLRPELLRLFGVEWVIERTSATPPEDAVPVVAEGRFTLYQLLDAEPRASIVFSWRRLTADDALAAVLQPGFDPAVESVVETDPIEGGQPIAPDPVATGTASYSETAPEHVLIQITGTSPGLLLVRNAYDRNWHASIDGKPAPLLVADYLMQGVAVPAGAHVVEITYRDGAIGSGGAISAVAWGFLLGAIGLLAIRQRRSRLRSRQGEPPPAAG